MEGWGQVTREVRQALTSDKAVKHAEKMVGKDNRMRVFKPKGSPCGAKHLCQQAHVDLAAAGKSDGMFIFSQLQLGSCITAHLRFVHGARKMYDKSRLWCFHRNHRVDSAATLQFQA